MTSGAGRAFHIAASRRCGTVRIPSGTASGAHYIGMVIFSEDAKAGDQRTQRQDVLEITVR